MSGAPAEVVAIALLLLSLGVAVVRPGGLSEAFGALPSAVVLVAAGVVPWSAAVDTLRRIGPTVGFLAAILVLGALCADAGVFDYLGGVAARASRGRPHQLLALVVALAAGVTATLTLDATVVLLTPVVLTTARRLRVVARPHLYACTRIANSGSLLLPVSNLTNLLAFGAAGLSFGRFTALMAGPWLIVCVLEWVALRVAFRRDLTAADVVTASPPQPVPPSPSPAAPAAPRYALVVLAGTVALFVVASSVGVAVAWAALAGCLALLGPRVADRTRRAEVSPRTLASAASPGFCFFVLALAVVVDGVARHGLGDGLRHVLPDGSSLLTLLGVAAVAAVLANLVNNVPATLALLPIVAGHPPAVLAVLIGVNIGPNATYVGSLATLLWRRLLPAEEKPAARQFHALGLTATPVLIVVATVALRAGLSVVGG